MMSIRGFALIALGLMFLSACEKTPTEPNESLRYFPLSVGNNWTYAPEDPFFGQPFQWLVTERNGDTVDLARPSGGSHPGPVRLLDRFDEIDLLLGSESPLPFYRFSAGETWEHSDLWECDDGPTLVAVDESNPIVTPAGTFSQTIRIQRQTAATCSDAGTITEWWAPDVGLVQWEELNFYAGGPLKFYLTDYDVD